MGSPLSIRNKNEQFRNLNESQTQGIEPGKIKDEFKVSIFSAFRLKYLTLFIQLIQIVVGIDFGTDGVALAYSFPNKDNGENNGDKDDGSTFQEIKYHKWKTKLDTNDMKRRAQILLDGQGKLKVFGSGVAKIIEEFGESQESSDESDGGKQQQNEYTLIEKLKMSSYNDPRWIKEQTRKSRINKKNQVLIISLL